MSRLHPENIGMRHFTEFCSPCVCRLHRTSARFRPLQAKSIKNTGKSTSDFRMCSSFHGERRRRAYFEGWYLKQQNGTDTVAFIPAFHVDAHGQRSASLQIVTDTDVYNIPFPIQAFSAAHDRFLVWLGDCVFSSRGCKLSYKGAQLSVTGVLRYGALVPPAYDIMGPFRFVPFMQCRHSVYSFSHRVDGALNINGRQIEFYGGTGYMEGDRGTSFPRAYLWTQCNWEGNCVMLSVADIPFYGGGFTGCIGSIWFVGREYRLATYRGVKLLHISETAALVRQGGLTLLVKQQGKGHAAHPLCAPQNGSMLRTVHESPSCTVRYRCTLYGRVLFDFVSEQASFETSGRIADEPFTE